MDINNIIIFKLEDILQDIKKNINLSAYNFYQLLLYKLYDLEVSENICVLDWIVDSMKDIRCHIFDNPSSNTSSITSNTSSINDLIIVVLEKFIATENIKVHNQENLRKNYGVNKDKIISYVAYHVFQFILDKKYSNNINCEVRSGLIILV